MIYKRDEGTLWPANHPIRTIRCLSQKKLIIMRQGITLAQEDVKTKCWLTRKASKTRRCLPQKKLLIVTQRILNQTQMEKESMFRSKTCRRRRWWLDPLQIHKAMIDLRKNGMSFALSSNWISQVIIKILSSLDALKRMTKLELRWFIINSLTRWSNQKAKEVYDMKIPSNGSWPQQKKTISSTK